MKNSTRKNSSKPGIKNVRGIIFFNKECMPRFVTVEAWVAAGKPSDCFVYDGAHQLLSARIPISDAVEVEGRWIRTPVAASVSDTKYRRVPMLKKKRVRASTIPLVESEFITGKDAKARKLR